MYLGANRFVKNMAKTDSRTSKSIKKQFGGVGVLFHQPDPPILFKEDFLGLFRGRRCSGLNTTATNFAAVLEPCGIGGGSCYCLYPL